MSLFVSQRNWKPVSGLSCNSRRFGRGMPSAAPSAVSWGAIEWQGLSFFIACLGAALLVATISRKSSFNKWGKHAAVREEAGLHQSPQALCYSSGLHPIGVNQNRN